MFNALLTHCKKIRLFYFSARQKKSSWDGIPFVDTLISNFLFHERKSQIFTVLSKGDGPPILANLVGNLVTLH
jgi:hypothetical protein